MQVQVRCDHRDANPFHAHERQTGGWKNDVWRLSPRHPNAEGSTDFNYNGGGYFIASYLLNMALGSNHLSARQAAELLQRTADQARERLLINQPLIYAAWGVAWLIGCGAMWLWVLGQHPLRGAAGWASAILGTGIVLAIVATAITVGRATRGIGGISARQGMMYGLSWPVGFASLSAIIGAASHFGASPKVLGVFGAAGRCCSSDSSTCWPPAMWLDRVMFWTGVWDSLVAAIGALDRACGRAIPERSGRRRRVVGRRDPGLAEPDMTDADLDPIIHAQCDCASL